MGAETMHYLKIWPEFFMQLRNGYSTCQIRKNDRGFKQGDKLRLQEYVPGPKDKAAGPQGTRNHKADGVFTGSSITCVVSEVHKDVPGICKGYCVLSLKISYNNCGFSTELAGKESVS